MSTRVVVGAGPSGLGCAQALIAHGPVVVVDRIPVTGGSAGWDHPVIRQVTRRLTERGVEWRLGVTAMRWSAPELHVIGVDGSAQLRTDPLFFAGGCRARTAVECGINGERPAGVIPATVAEHLLTTRQRLWERPVVVGSGPWADRLKHALTDGGIPYQQVQVASTDQLTIRGTERVTSLALTSIGGSERSIGCDAVILADGAVPVRNAIGAIDDAAARVVFVQPVPSGDVNERIEAGRRIVTAWLAAHRPGGSS